MQLYYRLVPFRLSESLSESLKSKSEVAHYHSRIIRLGGIKI